MQRCMHMYVHIMYMYVCMYLLADQTLHPSSLIPSSLGMRLSPAIIKWNLSFTKSVKHDIQPNLQYLNGVHALWQR